MNMKLASTLQANSTSPARRVLNIEQAAAELQNEIGLLGEALNELDLLLQPIVPPPCAGMGNESRPTADSEFCELMLRMCDHVRSHIDLVRSINARL